MIKSFFLSFCNRVPWGKFFLLWFLALLMGSSLLWLHYGFTRKILVPTSLFALGSAMGILWGTTRPRWQKAHCSWCGSRVGAHSMRFEPDTKIWVLTYLCSKCGQATERRKDKIGG
jgi:hypothetical protein